MKHLTMQELDDLGFKVIKSYKHDNFLTQRRRKGFITIETTWKVPWGQFCTQDIFIDSINFLTIKNKDLKKLDKILNHAK